MCWFTVAAAFSRFALVARGHPQAHAGEARCRASVEVVGGRGRAGVHDEQSVKEEIGTRDILRLRR